MTGGEVTGHDGEHIDDLLQALVLPDAVVMNPPFASSVDRSRDKHIAAKHLIAAAKRLAPGGRLVAIMPPGFTPERDASHWARACRIVMPRLALTVPLAWLLNSYLVGGLLGLPRSYQIALFTLFILPPPFIIVASSSLFLHKYYLDIMAAACLATYTVVLHNDVGVGAATVAMFRLWSFYSNEKKIRWPRI